MIQECLEVFQRKLEKYGEAFVTDAYLPKDGTYRMIEIRENGFQILNTIEIRYDKKNGNLIGANEQDYIWFATWDYYSKLLEMNKPMDSSKTIHTNNYLSFAVKKESIQNQKLTNEIIANYYQILKNPKLKYQKKKNSQYLYERVEQKIGKPDTELIDRIAHYMLEDNRWTDIDLDKKDYVKIFFVFPDREKTKEYYQRENERYLVPNIYNSNDYNLTIENEIYGLPNNNMGLNGKKPYLENKTRKNPVPNLVNQEQALLQNQMFDYFWSQSSRGKNNIYINNEEENPDIKAYDNTKEPEFLQSGYYIRIKKDKNEVSVEQADVIVDYNPNLKRAFVLKDMIGFSDIISEDIKKKYSNYDTLWQVKDLLDMAFYEGRLKYGFDTDIKELSFHSEVVRQCFALSRETLLDWFWLGVENQVLEVMDKVTLRLIKNTIAEGSIFRAQHQFNVRWTLLNYLDETRKVGENMSQLRKELREHINMEDGMDWEFSSDEEFSYAVGQAVSYLFSLSKAKDKDESIINSFLNTCSVKILKSKLRQLYQKYNYGIQHDSRGRFGRMAAEIMEYEPKEINSELLMAGFVSASLIYEKKNK